MTGLNRREAALGLLGTAAFAWGTIPASATQSADALTNAILHDPAAPVVGNPKGDVTIVAFLDYNCPFCRRATPDLDKLIATDHKVRVVYKDWPILAKSSVFAARVALAANLQGKYAVVHDALMRMNARPATEEDISAAAHAPGVDIDRLNKDLDAHGDDIGALLKRNFAQADALGLTGTPVYLIGPFMKAGVLDFAGFTQVVSDARDRLAHK